MRMIYVRTLYIYVIKICVFKNMCFTHIFLLHICILYTHISNAYISEYIYIYILMCVGVFRNAEFERKVCMYTYMYSYTRV